MSWTLQAVIAVPVVSAIGYLIGLLQTLVRRKLRANAVGSGARDAHRVVGYDPAAQRSGPDPLRGQ